MSFSAIIFDMDGLLVDSEPLWYEVETQLIESNGYVYADDVRAKTIGLRLDEFASIIYEAYPQIAESAKGIAEAVLNGMIAMPKEKIMERPGASQIIEYVAGQNIPRAIASSSLTSIINHFVEMLDWDDLIPQRYSADGMKHGKPAPDIYLHTAKQLAVAPENCLALEDSRAGARAAVSAGMTCYVVPDLSHSAMSDFEDITPHIYPSLHDVLDEIKTKRLFS